VAITLAKVDTNANVDLAASPSVPSTEGLVLPSTFPAEGPMPHLPQASEFRGIIISPEATTPVESSIDTTALGGSDVSVFAHPSETSEVVGRLTNGTAIELDCITFAQQNNGNAVWWARLHHPYQSHWIESRAVNSESAIPQPELRIYLRPC
jgi:hypothetical protein